MSSVRLPGDSPNPAYVKAAGPLKMIVISLIIFSGLLLLIGIILTDSLPALVVKISGVVFGVLLICYCAIVSHLVHKREAMYIKDCADRKAKLSEFEALGFQPTFKSIGSSRMFLVDENTERWCIINYFNNPKDAELQPLSLITGVTLGKNSDYVPSDQTILMFNGKFLNANDNAKYFSQEGVVLQLDDKERPTAFINCFKTEGDVTIIMSYMQSLIESRKKRSLKNLSL